MSIWDKINKATSTFTDAVDGVMSSVTGAPSPAAEAEAEKTRTVFDEFKVTLAVGTKPFRFTETSMIYGGIEHPYTTMSEISLTTVASKMTNGIASTIIGGKAVTLAFSFVQAERFHKAMKYANEQIALAHGKVKDYRYFLQAEGGSHIEVYDSHLQLSYVPSGVGNLVSNTMRGGAIDIIVRLCDAAMTLDSLPAGGSLLRLTHDGAVYELKLSAEDTPQAKEAFAFINAAVEAGDAPFGTPALAAEPWQPAVPQEHRFALCGAALEVPAEMDAFNTYYGRFSELAKDAAACARAEFDKRVSNLTTYLQLFPEIYKHYLGIVCDKAMEILIAEGIWSVTKDSLMELHCGEFHLAPDDYAITMESVQLTVQENQQAVSAVTGLIPNLVGGGFGLKGAVKGIATATAFNIVRDSAEAGLLKSASTINLNQQTILYDRIDHDILFEHVFSDYWRMFMTLSVVLNQAGKTVWWPTDDRASAAANIFTNLANPNFPQNQLLNVFLQILQTNPYNEDYHRFMLTRFGQTDETLAIARYFHMV